MPTFESKFGVGDRAITVHGRQCVIISKILIDESGVRYLTADSGAYLTEADLHPAPPEPEVWPKVRNGWGGNTLDYADGKPRPCGSDGFAERVAKLERLAWLVCGIQVGRGINKKPLVDEYHRLRLYFVDYHGPNGEVYLEPRKEP